MPFCTSALARLLYASVKVGFRRRADCAASSSVSVQQHLAVSYSCQMQTVQCIVLLQHAECALHVMDLAID